MKNKLNPSTKINATVLSVLLGIIAALLVTLAGAIICTSMMNRGTIGENGISVSTLIVWFASSLAGNLIACRLKETQVLPVVLITASIYILCLMGCKIILFDAPFYGIGKGIIAILLGAIPCVLISGRHKSGKRTKFKYTSK